QVKYRVTPGDGIDKLTAVAQVTGLHCNRRIGIAQVFSQIPAFGVRLVVHERADSGALIEEPIDESAADEALCSGDQDSPALPCCSLGRSGGFRHADSSCSWSSLL